MAGRRDAPRLVAFDVLQLDDQELRDRAPFSERCALLEALLTEHALAPPWTLCPKSSDLEQAQEWMSTWTQVPGVEGVVAKGLGQRYEQGRRAWVKGPAPPHHRGRHRRHHRHPPPPAAAAPGPLRRGWPPAPGGPDDAAQSRKPPGSWPANCAGPAPATRGRGCGSPWPGEAGKPSTCSP
ncbi:hypothetical protein ABZ419_26600 [Streptomyces cinnamoneus]|uniref:ATP-dependent DNA ligase n=1 Tax=Streptomyces cinnamoneus TaxID=53446 RepID=UPI0033C0E7E2